MLQTKATSWCANWGDFNNSRKRSRPQFLAGSRNLEDAKGNWSIALQERLSANKYEKRIVGHISYAWLTSNSPQYLATFPGHNAAPGAALASPGLGCTLNSNGGYPATPC